MTNQQLYIAIGLPILAVLTSLTVSILQIAGIREEMRNLRDDTHAQLAAIHADIRELRADMKLLTGKVYELMSK